MIYESHSDLASQFIPKASVLAELSSRIICRQFIHSKISVEEKADRSIVTKTDKDAEAQMRDYIHRTFPDHGIIGEEFGEENTDAEFVWYLDPIDGTISFVTGVPLFGTLIGLCFQGQPILGVINQPILNQLCIGTNDNCTLNGKKIQVSSTSTLAESTLLTTDFQAIDKHQTAETFQALSAQVRQSRTWGDCYGYLLVSCGKAEMMLDPFMHPWDLMPLIPIIRGAQGVITAWDGSDPVNANSCVASSSRLHPQIISILSGIG